MYNDSNIFAQIISGKVPCSKVYEDDDVLAFHDINPVSPVHVVVIPKVYGFKSFNDFVTKAEPPVVANFFSKIAEIAATLGLQESGYRLITNHGKNAIQTIEHFHVHILGGKRLGPLISDDKYHI